MSDDRRSDPGPAFRQATPCDLCGFCYDHGASGARMCPQCCERELDERDAFVDAMRPMLRAQLQREEDVARLVAAVCHAPQRTPIH